MVCHLSDAKLLPDVLLPMKFFVTKIVWNLRKISRFPFKEYAFENVAYKISAILIMAQSVNHPIMTVMKKRKTSINMNDDWWIWQQMHWIYRKTSNISYTLEGNKIGNHSVGDAPTTSSFSI